MYMYVSVSIYIYESGLNKRVDHYMSEFTSFNRVESNLYEFVSFNNQAYFRVHERLI